jgi:glycosyltransferase involved in cell wall biosynthesis
VTLATICIPTIGRMDYLPAVRDAVRAQTMGDFEVLVLDNDAPEPAKSWLEAWAAEEPRLRILRQSPRIPMFENFDRGIRAAKGKYVTFMHDDDVYLPHYLETPVKLMEANPRVGFTGANFDYVDEHDQLLEKRRWIAKSEVWPGRRYIDELVTTGRNLIPMQGLTFRREVFGDRGFDRDVSPHFGDFVILARIAERYDVGVFAEPVMHVRKHAAQASGGFPASKWAVLRRDMLVRYCAEYRARHPGEEAFVRKLERAIALRYRLSLVWGWAAAEDNGEADACVAQLDGNAAERVAGRVLTGIGRAVGRKRVRLLADPATLRRFARMLRV